jgi:hypothetical protein
MRAANDVQMPSQALKAAALLKAVEAGLEKRWPPKGDEKYVVSAEPPYVQLNQRMFEASHVSELEAETAAAEVLGDVLARQNDEIAVKSAKSATPEGRQVEPLTLASVYPVAKMRSGEIPDTELGRMVLHSYSPYVGWAIWLNFGAFQFPGTEEGATHYSSFAYDRHVPLELYGAMFVPGTYHDRVAPVDIAATFASILRVNQPSSVEGHVLTQVMKPDTGDGVAAARATAKRSAAR